MQYQIPLYQRAFSWGEKALEQLWDDILFQAILGENGKIKNHFLGAIVMVRSSDDGNGKPTLTIVDGQQRFTTLTLLLAAIRDRWKEVGGHEGESTRINEHFLIDRHGKGDERLRLLPTPFDLESYRNIVLDRNPVDGKKHNEHLITETYNYFRRRIQRLDLDEAAPSLTWFERAATDRLKLVSITVNEEENPHAIFESLNSTGLLLGQSDLMRNFLFMKLGEESERIYEKYWRPMQQSLNGVEAVNADFDDRNREEPTGRLDRLLWMQLVIAGEKNTKEEQLFKATVRTLFRNDTSAEKIKSYVQEVYRRSRHYEKMIDPRCESNELISDRLHRLSAWNANVSKAAALLILDKREQGVVTDPDVVVALRLIESFLIRRMLTGRGTQGLAATFQSLPSQIRDSDDLVHDLHAALSKRTWPDDEEIAESFRTIKFFEKGTRSQRRFVLQSLVEANAHPEKIDVKRSNLTIEHVLPQNPSGNWWAVLRDDGRELVPRLEPIELRDQLVHLIGNLTLSGHNKSLSNHEFERKQQILENSNLPMNRKIAQTERWGRTEILKRCDELAELAVQVWPGPLR